MGIDLTVLVSYFRERRGEFFPTASLRFERDHRLFAQLSADATRRWSGCFRRACKPVFIATLG